jgi:hypothetical protein
MTADVIVIDFVPPAMACCGCDGETFTLHVDNTVRCSDCGAEINAKWELATSSSPPTDGVPAAAA